MSHNHPALLLKMTTYFHSAVSYFEQIIHPAAGKGSSEKKRKRSGIPPVISRATPDSLNIRELMKKQDSFRRNPAP
jgi:hypothetical protein